MSEPFSRLPDPGVPRPFKRRLQPQMIQETLRFALRAAEEYAQEARRYAEDLWRRGKRHPRAIGLAGVAVAVTLVGAYALSASGTGRSLCPANGSKTGKGKAPSFQVLMDPVPPAAAGSELEISYDVCGLPSGTAYRGRVQLAQQQAPSKKKKKATAKPKPLVVTFHDKVDGVASRRTQELELGATKPGAYTLELSVTDNRGRERKKTQKLVVKAP